MPLLQALSQSAELAHQRNADLAWSYHFGWPRQQLMVFPWTPSAEVVESLGQPRMLETIAAWYGHEVFTGGMPAHTQLGLRAKPVPGGPVGQRSRCTHASQTRNWARSGPQAATTCRSMPSPRPP